MSLINFESASHTQKNKLFERQVRKNVLAKAKQKYEKELQREKEAKERGETTWMLPTVQDKLDGVKKKKKRKCKKKMKLASSSTSSESEDGDHHPAMWIEQSAQLAEPVKRDEWMEMTSLFKTRTREQMKIADGSSRALKKLEERKCKEEANKPGTQPRELNPFYKDGGTGLPSIQASTVPAGGGTAAPSSSYDVSWLRKALQRAKDKAAQEGRSLEEVAEERWGSLETFYKLLHEAEGKSETREKARKEPVRREKSRSRSRSRDRKGRNSRSRSRDRGRSISRDRSGSRDRSRGRDRRSKSREKDRRMKGGRSRSREEAKRRGRRSRSRSRSGSGGRVINKRSRSRERGNRDCSRSRSRDRGPSRKTGSTDSSHRSSLISPSRGHNSSSEHKDRKSNEYAFSSKMKIQDSGNARGSSLKKFLKPIDDMETSSQTREAPYPSFGTSRSSKSTSFWRKKGPETSQSPTDFEPATSDSHSISSESSSGSEEEVESRREELKEESKVDLPSKTMSILTDKEMNQLAAKLMKAELLGNEAQVTKLKVKLEAARIAREHHEKHASEAGHKEEEGEEKEVVILTRTNKRGFTRPVSMAEKKLKGKKNRKNKVEVFDADGKRTSYFADDFKIDLQSMFEKEKTTSAADQIAALEKLSCANVENLSDDFNVDDMFISKVAPKESGIQEKERDRLKAIWEHQRMQKTLDFCHFCVGNKLMKKHLIVALGTNCYLSLPAHQSLTEGHCLIVPLHHVSCGTQADEDLWQEITDFRQALVRAFVSNDMDCIFFESATKLYQTPHMVLHCVPLPKETGELAPIYFKKALMECDEEWAQNKKLIELKGRNVRQAVPKELPYFFVDFGMTTGFAHVVENDRLFPKNFAQEIIGGMIDADISLFRKPRLENFDVQCKKVLKFAKFFKPFEPTL